MTAIHVFYPDRSAPIFRRMADGMPFTALNSRFDEDCSADQGWLVVCEPAAEPIRTVIPRSRRAVCINEPSAMNRLPLSYLNQFGLLISPHHVRGYRGRWRQTHTGLPWFFGAEHKGGRLSPTLSLQALRELPLPQKSNTVSVVLSRKVFHEGHRTRLRLVEMLKGRLGSRLLVYGRGIREIRDKADAILPSALHLALENTIEPSYWTEKLSDALLGYALPVYGGCPNIGDWVSPDALLTIDPNRPEEACAAVEQALADQVYKRRLPAICEARTKILSQETIYHVIARAIEGNPSEEVNLANPETVRPPQRQGVKDRLCREAKRLYHQATFRSRLGGTHFSDLARWRAKKR